MASKRARKRPQEIFSGVWIDELGDSQAPLMAKELLDTLLEKLLGSFLAEDADELEAFSRDLNFDGRIRLAYLLGLISPEEAADLRLISRLRDEFAGSLGERTFADDDVGELVDALTTARQFRQHPASLGLSRDTRMRFNSAVHILARYLYFRVSHNLGPDRRTVHPPFRYAPPGEIPPVRND